jgi:hypothetical protein
LSSVEQRARPHGAITTSFDEKSANERVAGLIADLRYGTVEITVHDGRIVQIERTEKIRLRVDSAADR